MPTYTRPTGKDGKSTVLQLNAFIYLLSTFPTESSTYVMDKYTQTHGSSNSSKNASLLTETTEKIEFTDAGETELAFTEPQRTPEATPFVPTVAISADNMSTGMEGIDGNQTGEIQCGQPCQLDIDCSSKVCHENICKGDCQRVKAYYCDYAKCFYL